MVKSGSFKVKQGSLLGRIGEGVGKGLAESLPKEMERGRLAQGLEQFAKNAANLSPTEQFTRLLQIPGIEKLPQAIQQYPEILKQQRLGESYGKGLSQENAYKQSLGKVTETPGKEQGAGLQTPESTQATLEHFIEPTIDEMVAEAKTLPLWEQDPQGALGLIKQKFDALRNQNASLQQRRLNERNIQDTLKTNIDEGFTKLGVNIPGNISDKLKRKGYDLIRKGKTEEDASKEVTEEADKIARQYAGVNTLGGYGAWFRNPKSTYEKLGVLQKEFKERGDLRNFAQIVGNALDTSAPKSYAIAYPLTDIPKLFDYYKTIKPLKIGQSDTTDEISPQLFDLMGYEGSPLSIANALNAKGYDGNKFLKYAESRQKELAPDQVNQLALPTNPTLGDIFIENMGGIKGAFGLVPLFYGMFK
jgi:hypothetical protein